MEYSNETLKFMFLFLNRLFSSWKQWHLCIAQSFCFCLRVKINLENFINKNRRIYEDWLMSIAYHKLLGSYCLAPPSPTEIWGSALQNTCFRGKQCILQLAWSVKVTKYVSRDEQYIFRNVSALKQWYLTVQEKVSEVSESFAMFQKFWVWYETPLLVTCWVVKFEKEQVWDRQ